VNGSRPRRAAGIGSTASRGHSPCAVRCSLSPHPVPLPWYLFSARSAAVLGSSNVSTPKNTRPRAKPAAPEDGRTPLNTYLPCGELFSPWSTIQNFRRSLRGARCSLSLPPSRRSGALARREGGRERVRGKRRERPARVLDHSRNCRTGQVLWRSRRVPQSSCRALNDEFRMSNVERMPKHEIRIHCPSRPFFGFWISDFLRHWSLVIRHCAALS